MSWLDYSKLGASLLVMAAFSGMPASAATQDMCEQARVSNLTDLSNQVDPAVRQIDEVILDIKAKGGDPNAIAIKGEDGRFYTLPEIRAAVLAKRDATAETINAKAEECDAKHAPLQSLVDGTVAYYTDGLSLIAPGKMAYIDVSRILAGYPLGGPNALIPSIRDQAFNSLGMGKNNTIRVAVSDPLRAVRNLFGGK
jgi:hypothetical protein